MSYQADVSRLVRQFNLDGHTLSALGRAPIRPASLEPAESQMSLQI